MNIFIIFFNLEFKTSTFFSNLYFSSRNKSNYLLERWMIYPRLTETITFKLPNAIATITW